MEKLLNALGGFAAVDCCAYFVCAVIGKNRDVKPASAVKNCDVRLSNRNVMK